MGGTIAPRGCRIEQKLDRDIRQVRQQGVVRVATSVPIHISEIFNTENAKDHGGPQEFFALEYRLLTIGLAIEIHRTAGRGLLGSGYAEWMALEFAQAGIVGFEAQVAVPVVYKAIPMAFAVRRRSLKL